MKYIINKIKQTGQFPDTIDKKLTVDNHGEGNVNLQVLTQIFITPKIACTKSFAFSLEKVKEFLLDKKLRIFDYFLNKVIRLNEVYCITS